MRYHDVVAPAATQVIASLKEAPFHTELTGRDGLPCRVWLNPSAIEFANALRRASTSSAMAGLRGLLTATDLYIWQSTNLLHGDFERVTGYSGLRIAPRSNLVQVNDEAVAMPEQFPWLYDDPDVALATDVEDRRAVVEAWLAANRRLKKIYRQGFSTEWYS